MQIKNKKDSNKQKLECLNEKLMKTNEKKTTQIRSHAYHSNQNRNAPNLLPVSSNLDIFVPS